MATSKDSPDQNRAESNSAAATETETLFGSEPAREEELPELGHPETPMYAVWLVLGVMVASGLIGIGVGMRGPRVEEKLSVPVPASLPTTAPSPSASAATPPPEGPIVLKTIMGKQILVSYRGAEKAPSTVTRSKAEARTRAEELLGRVKKGEALDKLAAEFSDEPGAAEKRGDTGWFHERDVVPDLWNGVKDIEIGETSKVIDTIYGYYIVQRTK